MIRIVLLTCLALALSAALTPARAAPRADDGPIELLPVGARHDPGIPTPEQVIGFPAGRWHIRPELIERYARALAAASDRVSLIPYGQTHEQRPLFLLAITSPSNQGRLEALRSAHVARVKAGRPPAPGDPIVVWMGYSVHGNESSGANAAPTVAWHLASGLDDDVTGLLERAVVLIDPVINPDGLARHASWANSHKGQQLVPDSAAREHNEAWPGGRSNHYWFDLNRDWLLLTHPSSRGRVTQYHRWRPTVLTDFHEMGTGSTFFFQPGVPSRQNPLTPERNLELTRAIARFHAEAFDAIGQLYYTEESFDDFYYGKGSSYPDVLGAIGILFEQASSRGHLQENAWGPLPFELTIRNQVRASLSTLAAARALRAELLENQSAASRTALSAAEDSGIAGWVAGDARDPARTALLAELLLRHDLEVYQLAQSVDGEGLRFEPGAALWIPHRQPNGRLAHALFERRLEFPDDTFYDVSSWTLPLALGLPFAELNELPAGAAGARLSAAPVAAGSLQAATTQRTVAYAFAWGGLHAGRALQRLHAADIMASVATRPFTAHSADGSVEFEVGAIVVPSGVSSDPDALHEVMARVASEDGLDVLRLTSGHTPDGIDLGSPSMRPLKAPRVALVVGSGVSSYEAGEVWHHLDLRLELPVTLVEGDNLERLDLPSYTHLVLVDGASSAVSQSRVRDWVAQGGVLLSTRGSARWAARELFELELDDEQDDDGPDAGSGERSPAEHEPTSGDEPPSYGDYEARRAKTLVSGAIFAARVDSSHPLGFGLGPGPLALFRRGTTPLPRSEDPLAHPLTYLDQPLLSGYASDANVDKLAGTPAVMARRLGAGSVIMLADDPVFRGVWHGSARLLENALFFGAVIKDTRALTSAALEHDADAPEH